MLTVALSLLAAVAVAFGLRASNLVHSWVALIAPALIAFIVTALLLLRRASRLVEPLVKEAEGHIKGGRVEMALKTLEGGIGIGAWHPLVPAQLRSMIGSLYFDTGKMDKAEQALSRALRWPWTTKALLAVVYFRQRNEPKMVKAFETCVGVGSKEPLAWTLYAHCMLARGKREEAVKILERALKKNPKDGRLETNLELAQTGKKLKTAPYGDKWSRFGLDGNAGPSPALPKAARGFAVRPGFRQRSRKK
jgi:tetratricopeptide (TPR) repeat protein